MTDFKVGDKVRVKDSEKTYAEKWGLTGELTISDIDGNDKYSLVFFTGTTHAIYAFRLEYVEPKNDFYTTETKVTLNRGYIATKLPSGKTFTTCGGSQFVTLVGQGAIDNKDIPAIIEHLQKWYNAVQLEGTSK